MINEEQSKEVLKYLEKACEIISSNLPDGMPTNSVRKIQQRKELQRINSLLTSIRDVMANFIKEEKIHADTFINKRKTIGIEKPPGRKASV
tara:strand:- start:230 stop:502 length:273 start_codon:yes stop_codon:yes gene_type:complete